MKNILRVEGNLLKFDGFVSIKTTGTISYLTDTLMITPDTLPVTYNRERFTLNESRVSNIPYLADELRRIYEIGKDLDFELEFQELPIGSGKYFGISKFNNTLLFNKQRDN